MVLPISVSDGGGTAVISMVSYGAGVAQPFDEVGLVDQDRPGRGRRDAEDRLETCPDALDDARQPLRQRLFPLVRVDVEVRGMDGAKAQPRIVAGRRRAPPTRASAD